MKIKVGDLVCLPRRKTPGMGLVLKHLTDVSTLIGIEDPHRLLSEVGSHNWFKREATIVKVADECGLLEVTRAFFYYNSGPFKKYKNSFTLVKWFNAPSAWVKQPTKVTEQYAGPTDVDPMWYPSDWIKAY